MIGNSLKEHATMMENIVAEYWDSIQNMRVKKLKPDKSKKEHESINKVVKEKKLRTLCYKYGLEYEFMAKFIGVNDLKPIQYE